MKNREEVESHVRAWVAGQSQAESLAQLEKHGVPCGPIYRIDEIVADPHYAARENILRYEHPELGPVAVPNVVPKLSVSPGAVTSPPPRLGQHNREIYQGLLGLSEEELAALSDDGVI